RGRGASRESNARSAWEREGVRVRNSLSPWERDGVRVRNSLSLWERAGVRVRSIAGETKEKEFLSSRAVRSIAGETKEKEFLSSRAVNPHPDPLPEGEGNNGDLALSPWERDGMRVRSLVSVLPAVAGGFLSSRAV